MKCLSLALLLVLCACASPPVVYKPVTVDVPVRVACASPAVLDHPVWPFSEVTDKDSLFKQVRALLAERELRQGYEAKLEAVIKVCE